MTVPLMVLAAGALLAGFVNAAPWTHWLDAFLRRAPHLGGASIMMLASGDLSA